MLPPAANIHILTIWETISGHCLTWNRKNVSLKPNLIIYCIKVWEITFETGYNCMQDSETCLDLVEKGAPVGFNPWDSSLLTKHSFIFHSMLHYIFFPSLVNNIGWRRKQKMLMWRPDQWYKRNPITDRRENWLMIQETLINGTRENLLMIQEKTD